MTKPLLLTLWKDVTKTYMETDHVYSDHRIALQAAVLAWLDHLQSNSH
jgi:hypothetical protein